MLNLNQLKQLYTHSPLWIKKLYASIPYEVRNGKDYRKWQLFLSKELNMEEYQLLKIKELVSYAYTNTNYYKRVFDKLDISPYDINSLQDYEKLPLIDKDIVRDNYDDMTVRNYPDKNKFYVTTGGTSGEAMKFLQSKNVWKKELAFVMKYFSKFGYKPSMLKASFRGGEFNNLPKNTYWKYSPVHNQIHFSPFDLHEKNIILYVNELNKHKPRYFHSYPSSLLLLIDQMINKGLQLNYKVNAIFLISENFSMEDIEKIKLFFDCKISSFYGHSERLIFAPSFDENVSSYTVDEKYGLFELIDASEKCIGQKEERGQIVGSSFDNYAMPLLRYKTNDYTHYLEKGKHKVIANIVGRWSQEYLLGKNEQKIYFTALNMHSDIFKNVIQYQFLQTRPEYAELCIITNKFFKEDDSKNILKALKEKVGHVLEFKINIVEKMQLTPRGKFKNLI